MESNKNKKIQINYFSLYNYELNSDDSDCMTFLLLDYIGESILKIKSRITKRIQDFVFLLLRTGLTENQTLNIIIESLIYIPRLDILYECSIDYKDFEEYKFGKFISHERVLLFKIYNEFEEEDFISSLKIIFHSIIEEEYYQGPWMINLNKLLKFKNNVSIMNELASYFKKFGNDRTQTLWYDFEKYKKNICDDSNQLWINIMNNKDQWENNTCVLAINKGDITNDPNFATYKSYGVEEVKYQRNESYLIPEDFKVKSFCLIFDIHSYKTYPRNGTKFDVDRIRDSFTKMFFNVQLYEDLTTEQLFETANIFAKIENDMSGAMLVCFILAHGEKDCFFDINEEKVYIRQFSLLFSANNSKAYQDKPKIFFIQACQGKEHHKVVRKELNGAGLASEFQNMSINTMHNIPQMNKYNTCDTIPEEADFIFGLATTRNYVAYRNTKKGSWYIQELCKMLKEEANKKDIISILTDVINVVSKKKLGANCQLPSVYFTTRKKCFLKKQIS